MIKTITNNDTLESKLQFFNMQDPRATPISEETGYLIHN